MNKIHYLKNYILAQFLLLTHPCSVYLLNPVFNQFFLSICSCSIFLSIYPCSVSPLNSSLFTAYFLLSIPSCSVNSLNQSLSSFSSQSILVQILLSTRSYSFLLHIHSSSVSLPNLTLLRFSSQLILDKKLKVRYNDGLRGETTQRRSWRRKLAWMD